LAAPRVDRRLTAVLAADVVGYSRLVQRDEQGTLDRLKAHRKELIEPLVTEHGGRVVKLMGDGILCEFPSAVHAVSCAVAIQRGMAEREKDVAEAEGIRLRIGINVGDVVHESGDIFGDGVNVAARLEALAEPGGVLLARNVHNQVKDKLAFRFEPAGRHRVKNIAEPIEAWRVFPDGAAAKSTHVLARRQPKAAVVAVLIFLLLLGVSTAGWWWYGARSSPEAGGPPSFDRPAIAVLPFDDFGGEERQRRLANAFTEDLITELAHSRFFKVIARNSVEAFRSEGTDVRRVGRELGVRYVLEGSLRAEPERVRITAQLIEAATGTHLWAERYDRPANDLFAVRDEVLIRLVGTLTGQDGPIWREWQEAARRKPPQSLGAYDYLLLADEAYRRRGKEGTAEARRLAGEAIRLDARFAAAWRLLADAHFADALNGWSADRARSWELFHEAARRAAELDPADAAAQATLGMSHFVKGEVEPGLAAWDRALALSPNDAFVKRIVGAQLPIAGGVERAGQGVELVERALFQLDPFHPPYHWLSLGIPLYFAGRYAEAVAALEKVPDPWLEPRVMLALSYSQAGSPDKARAQAEEVRKLDPGFSAEAWVDDDFYQPGGSSAALFFDGARKAGLPLCAPAVEAARFDPRNRLPECEAERAKAAAPKM
jgi:class 3 adenylate cyclase/TolB-like protein